MGVSYNGAFPQQPWGFPTENDHFEVFGGLPPLKETLKYYSEHDSSSENIHPRKLTCPLKWDYFNRKYIFQTVNFQGTC